LFRRVNEIFIHSNSSIPLKFFQILNNDKKQKVASFISFTGASEKHAIQYLEKFKWDTAIAVDEYFIEPPEQDYPTFDEAKIIDNFSKYSTDGDFIEEDGIERFFSDIGLDGNDIVSLAVAWKFDAKNCGEFSKKEFVEGFKRLNCETLHELKSLLPGFKNEIVEVTNFRHFYSFVFDYAKGDDDKKKILETDIAIGMWQLVLKERFHFLDLWVEFVKGKQHGIPRIHGYYYLNLQ